MNDDTMSNIRVIVTLEGWEIRCKPCGWHVIPNKRSWTYDGNAKCPTFAPSINEAVNLPEMKGYNPEVASRRCHFTNYQGYDQLQR